MFKVIPALYFFGALGAVTQPQVIKKPVPVQVQCQRQSVPAKSPNAIDVAAKKTCKQESAPAKVKPLL